MDYNRERKVFQLPRGERIVLGLQEDVEEYSQAAVDLLIQLVMDRRDALIGDTPSALTANLGDRTAARVARERKLRVCNEMLSTLLSTDVDEVELGQLQPHEL